MGTMGGDCSIYLSPLVLHPTTLDPGGVGSTRGGASSHPTDLQGFLP